MERRLEGVSRVERGDVAEAAEVGVAEAEHLVRWRATSRLGGDRRAELRDGWRAWLQSQTSCRDLWSDQPFEPPHEIGCEQRDVAGHRTRLLSRVRPGAVEARDSPPR